MWEEQLNAAIEAGVAAIEDILKIYNKEFMKKKKMVIIIILIFG